MLRNMSYRQAAEQAGCAAQENLCKSGHTNSQRGAGPQVFHSCCSALFKSKPDLIQTIALTTKFIYLQSWQLA